MTRPGLDHHIRGVLLWCACALSLAARAADSIPPAPLRGSLKVYGFQPIHAPGDMTRAGVRGQLAANGRVREALAYHAAVNVEFDAALDARVRARPVELYLDYTAEEFDLRLGKQFIYWGRATWVNPTDVFTAWDYARIGSEAEDYRLAPDAVRLDRYFPGETRLEVVWAPLFTASRVDAGAPENIGGAPVQVRERVAPDGGEYGVRLSQTVSEHAWDWALSLYRGFEKQPAYAVAPVSGAAPGVAGAYTWTPHYPSLWMAGGDFAKALGKAVVKGEFAVKRAQTRLEGAEDIRTRLEGVIGVNHPVSEDLDAGVQYLFRHHMDKTAMQQQATDAFTERTFAQQGSLWLNYRFNPDMDAQLTALYSVTYRDYFALAFAWWDFAEALRATAGLVAFGGERQNTPYARQRESSQAFVEVRYAF